VIKRKSDRNGSRNAQLGPHLKNRLTKQFEGGFFVFYADYRQQSCFEETPLKQVLHDSLLNFTQKRYKYLTAFEC